MVRLKLQKILRSSQYICTKAENGSGSYIVYRSNLQLFARPLPGVCRSTLVICSSPVYAEALFSHLYAEALSDEMQKHSESFARPLPGVCRSTLSQGPPGGVLYLLPLPVIFLFTRRLQAVCNVDRSGRGAPAPIKHAERREWGCLPLER